jgi:hypothetical protein
MNLFDEVKARIVAHFRENDGSISKKDSDQEVLDHVFNITTAQNIVNEYGVDMDKWDPITKDVFMYIITRNTSNMFRDEA